MTDSFAHRSVSRAQHTYGTPPATTSHFVPQDIGEHPENPLSGKASTMTSVSRATTWRTPKNLAYGAQTSKSTVFDDTPSSTATVARTQ
jgi:hypothetical protein